MSPDEMFVTAVTRPAKPLTDLQLKINFGPLCIHNIESILSQCYGQIFFLIANSNCLQKINSETIPKLLRQSKWMSRTAIGPEPPTCVSVDKGLDSRLKRTNISKNMTPPH